jgi:SAM-dependent methyltransferase
LGRSSPDQSQSWLRRAGRGAASGARRTLDLLPWRRGGWRERSDPIRGRRRALSEEVDYWAHWVRTAGGDYQEEFAYRFDPDADVEDPMLREVLAGIEQQRQQGGQIAILDVGAGPASTVGHRFGETALEVVAVDPLADRYDRLLDDAGLVPPVRTEALDGERLLERFGPDRFDIAYSRNALDHAVDPVLIVEQMVAVVRRGGHVLLRHARNEAVHQDYVQLHQWNFDERDGDFIVWRGDEESNVTELLAGRAEVTCRRDLGEDDDPSEEEFGWIVCVISKPA